MIRSLRCRCLTLLALAVCVWAGLGVARPAADLGDRIQIALPLVGAACAAGRGELGDYAGRFVAMMVVVHGAKNTLGRAPINLRPGGGGRGFPSGHTAASVYGASRALRDCAGVIPYVGPAMALAAGYVGGSRLDAGKHSLTQVMAGALVGVLFDLGLRGAAGRAAMAPWRRGIRRGLVRGAILVARLNLGGRARRYQA